ncbi:17330_t:CDS:2 [Rhizophagus irregularis]|nr:17330_t:CDS:2 [Rhizophagus irregularis]
MIHFMKIVGVEWYEWVGQCQKVPSILILDETQTIYEDVNKADESMKGTGTAVEFWGVIKCAFKEIRFTHEELEAYVKDCCGKNFGDDYIISQFIRYIKYATVGHVGLVRHILQHTKDAMQFLSNEQMKIWQYVCLKRKIGFTDSDDDKYLIRSGVLVIDDNNNNYRRGTEH